MIIELNIFRSDGSGTKLLINTDKLISVLGSNPATVCLQDGLSYQVEESCEEIKKRLGLDISPRAETLAVYGYNEN